jgi:hypothetical protein
VDCIRVYGSPDIPADIEVSERCGRKQLKTTLHAIKNGRSQETPSQRADPRFLAAWELLGWTKDEAEKHRSTEGGADADYLATLNRLVDEKMEAEQ